MKSFLDRVPFLWCDSLVERFPSTHKASGSTSTPVKIILYGLAKADTDIISHFYCDVVPAASGRMVIYAACCSAKGKQDQLILDFPLALAPSSGQKGLECVRPPQATEPSL